MVYLNTKAQAGNVFIAFFLVIIVGLLLSATSPILNDFRVEAINNLDANSGALYEIVLYALMPIVWFLYLFASLVFIAVTANASRGGI